MYMTYTTNPNLPKVRLEAVKLVRADWSTRQVARYTGFNQSTIVRWSKKAPLDLRGLTGLKTCSSRPLDHPNRLSDELVEKIIEYRRRHKRCAEVIHHLLIKDGYSVSLSSVKRTLKRQGLVYPSKWKRWHKYPERPKASKPGILVEIDTIHDGETSERLYVYTLLDVFSRWAYAIPCIKIDNRKSLRFVKEVREIAPFEFSTLQSDHGSEFSKWFTKRIYESGLSHRHSRVRTPSDNGHLERFNRTLQDECLRRVTRSFRSWDKEIPEYLNYYNKKRPHMALDMQSPLDIIKRCQAIG